MFRQKIIYVFYNMYFILAAIEMVIYDLTVYLQVKQRTNVCYVCVRMYLYEHRQFGRVFHPKEVVLTFLE